MPRATFNRDDLAGGTDRASTFPDLTGPQGEEAIGRDRGLTKGVGQGLDRTFDALIGQLERAPVVTEGLIGAGLTGLILSQATLNLFAVLGLAPLTGVPLPFISYGGSSMIAVAFGMGLILALTRRRPEGERVVRTVISRDPVPDPA